MSPPTSTTLGGTAVARSPVDRERCQRCAPRVARLAVIVNVALGVFKLGVAVLAGSAAVAADGIQSLGCAGVALLVFAAMRVGNRGADDRHPFGYGKAEFLVAVAAYVVLFGLGLALLASSAWMLLRGATSGPRFVALPVSLLSVVANYLLYQACLCSARAVRSPGLLADAKQNRADMYSSFAVAIGVALAQLGPAWFFCDALAALVVSLLIMKDAAGSWVGDMSVVLERRAAPEELEPIRRMTMQTAEVQAAPYLRLRRVGRRSWLEMSIAVSEDLTVAQFQDVATRVRMRVLRRLPRVEEVDVYAARPTVEPQGR